MKIDDIIDYLQNEINNSFLSCEISIYKQIIAYLKEYKQMKEALEDDLK